jgi:hypothetical protein
MAFTDWDSYVTLLDAMYEQRGQWDSAGGFAEFDRLVRQNCGGLVGGEGNAEVGVYGYDGLASRLGEEFGGDNELVFEQIRLAALARPAAEYGLGEQWRGYVISTRPDGGEVYAETRFAEPSGWAKIEVAALSLALAYDEETGLMYDATDWYLRDGRTKVWPDPATPGGYTDGAGNLYIRGELQAPAAAADPAQPHFDTAAGRWRRRSADGEFEHYHDGDGVWERRRDQYWYRYHSDRFGWLAYDGPSMTWLDPTTGNTTWRGHDEVGQPPAGAPSPAAEPVAQEPVAQEPPAQEPADGDQVIESIEALRERLQREGLQAAEAAGLVPGLVSAEQFLDYLDDQVLQGLTAAPVS